MYILCCFAVLRSVLTLLAIAGYLCTMPNPRLLSFPVLHYYEGVLPTSKLTLQSVLQKTHYITRTFNSSLLPLCFNLAEWSSALEVITLMGIVRACSCYVEYNETIHQEIPLNNSNTLSLKKDPRLQLS